MADNPTTVRIPADIKEAVLAIARKEHRNFNSQLIVALEEHIERHKEDSPTV